MPLPDQLTRDSVRHVAHDACLGCDSTPCVCAPLVYNAGDFWEPSIESVARLYPAKMGRGIPLAVSERRILWELRGDWEGM